MDFEKIKERLEARVKFVNIIKSELNYLDLMRFRCFFHDLTFPSGVKEEQIQALFFEIEKETNTNKPFYSNQANYKVLLRVEKRYDPVDSTEHYFLGKMIKSEKDIDYGKEKQGELLDLVMENGTGIFNKFRGVVFFLFYIDSKTGKRVLMLEDVPFSIGVGTITKYLKERLSLGQDKEILSMQIPGRDFVSYMNSVGNSSVIVACIKLKKAVDNDAMKQIGIVDDILKAAKDKDFSTELVLRWPKRKRPTLASFLQQLSKKEQMSDIGMTNFSELFRIISFDLDNSAQPNVNLLNRLLRFELPSEKIAADMTDEMIYGKMLEFFVGKKEQII